MIPLASNPAEEIVSQGRKNALLKLLTDEDPEVYRTIRQRILSLGETAVEWLRPQLLSEDPVLRRRVHAIILELAKQSADNRFLSFCLSQGEDLDLEQGALLLAQTEYPLINAEGYRAWLDFYAGELRERLKLLKDSEQLLQTMNHFLFHHLGFSGNEQNYYEPENSYLNKVMDRRTGNPVTLCLLYLVLSRRLRLPVAGIAMPGHFLARFQNSTSELYIDAFNRGKLLTKADCIRYLMHTSHGFQEGSLTPVSQRKVLHRMCSNLLHIYLQLEATEESARFQRYVVALAS